MSWRIPSFDCMETRRRASSRKPDRLWFGPNNALASSSSQMRSSRVTPSGLGSAAIAAALSAPTEQPMSTSGRMCRSSSARSIPT